MTAPLLPYRFTRAIVRTPAKSVIDGLRADAGEGPSYDGVVAEHAAYVEALRGAGVAVTTLPALEAFPDSVFVEDPALVFPEGAILLRLAAPSRSGEVAAIAPALCDAFDVIYELHDGFADGGDVLATGETIMVGRSARTDRIGAETLLKLLGKLGHRAEIVETPKGVLHFTTDCSLVDEETMLSTARLAASGVFKGFDTLIVPEGEEGAANALRVNDALLVGAGYPRTIDLLARRGSKVVPLATTDIEKIDARVSCMSLLWA